MCRALHVALLSLLLLAMQQQAYVHPIEHLAHHEKPSPETVASSPHAEESCGLCTLLAGGSLAVLAATPPQAAGARDGDLVFHAFRSRAGEVPAWFESRAPPVLP